MDVLDKFFTKYSYKFPKGYPDMNNEQDILLMESLLSDVLDEKFIFEAYNRQNSIKAALDFVEKSEFAKDNNVKNFTSYKYANRINSSQEKDLNKLMS